MYLTRFFTIIIHDYDLNLKNKHANLIKYINNV